VIAEKHSQRSARFLERLETIADLSAADYRTVLRLLDALHTARHASGPNPRLLRKTRERRARSSPKHLNTTLRAEGDSVL
jgi:hypothetical protein